MNAFLTPVGFNQYCDVVPSQPLAVKISSFQGYLNTNKVTLNWTIAENEMVSQFDVERSTDGTYFSTAAMVFGSDKTGSENYQFAQPMNTDVIYYRLKMIDKNNKLTYSKVLVFKTSTSRDFSLKVLNNPVTDKLSVSFETNNSGPVTISLLDMAGRQVMQQKLNSFKGSNMISIPLPVLHSGMYVVDLFDGTTHNATKFIK
jgi:hypothetical protein